MGTDDAEATDKERASTAETAPSAGSGQADADRKTHRGLEQFLARGLDKVKCVAVR